MYHYGLSFTYSTYIKHSTHSCEALFTCVSVCVYVYSTQLITWVVLNSKQTKCQLATRHTYKYDYKCHSAIHVVLYSCLVSLKRYEGTYSHFECMFINKTLVQQNRYLGTSFNTSQFKIETLLHECVRAHTHTFKTYNCLYFN